jgi:branched-chain amino acid aminotransferase
MQINGEWAFLGTDFITASQAREIGIPLNSVYEVIRVINGVPLFFEDHMQRLKKSCKKLNCKRHDLNEIKNILKLVIDKNNLVNANCRLEYLFYPSAIQFMVYPSPHQYPVDDMYTYGVKLVSFKVERPNPQVKQSIINNKIRSRISDLLTDKVYDVVLINSEDEITEGSRTNLFFIQGDRIFSAPRSQILEGITWSKILQLSSDLGIRLIERNIAVSELQSFEGCFLTGTSPKVLPVNQVNQIEFNPNHQIIRKLIQKYSELVSGYGNRFNW